MKTLLHLCSLILIPYLLLSQHTHEQITQDLTWRNIGPANQGGRIVDIEAYPNDFTKVYLATASGGVWKSSNAGTTWDPIFDDYETASIGDIALDPSNLNTVWVGTGEANNRNSVSWGNGVYKSTDGGDSFKNVGLESTHQIARILVNPLDSNDVCVCAIGHLWGYSGDRGLFQTKDGGITWQKQTDGLPSDGKTGCTDIVRDPQNSNILYAAFYHRLRKPYHFQSGGEAGGIYKSEDNGRSWYKLSTGLPTGDTGRIGLAIYEKDPKIIMAIVEAAKTDTLAMPGSGIYRSEDAGLTWRYMNTYNNRPFYYSQIRINPHNDKKVYLMTTRFMVSEDGGRNFSNGSADQEIHGDFHAMWLDPMNEDRYYIGADKGFSITHDGGKHFILNDNLPIAQFYRINYDMRDPYYVYGGLQDNGSYAMASFSRDARGILNDSNWKMHWGDGQDVAANPDDWTDMYSSMENGSYFKYNPQTRRIKRISPNAFNTSNYWDFFDKNAVDRRSDSRFNWSAPLVMSPHNPEKIFVAGNHLYSSSNKGQTWKIISPDLSTNDPLKRKDGISGGVTPDNTGAETHCSVTSIALSPISDQIIWVGTDDGNVQITKDAAHTWTNVRTHVPEVPEGIWVSRIVASSHIPGRAYLSFDGHRSDHFGTWVFKTEDYGESWQKITDGITRNETVRVVREDPRNPNLLFIGTETGIWYTIDQGSHWTRLKLNMPTVSIYDLKIHPRENDLIAGTHGRGIWILDDISPLQYAAENMDKDFDFLDQKEATLWENTSRGGQRGHFWFAGDNPKTIQNTSTLPRAAFKNTAAINYVVNDTLQDSLYLIISDSSRGLQRRISIPSEIGAHRYYWNLEFTANAFSEQDLADLDTLLQTVIAEIGNSRVNRICRNFKKTKDSDKIRRMIHPLTGGYLNFEFEERFRIPVAEAGHYQIALVSGSQEVQSSLTIREDPMLKE